MPPLGKRRLRVMLAREGTALSESAVGRILAKGLRLGRIRPCAFLRGRAKAKRRRGFAKGHAVPWRRHMKARRPGEWLQIDHTGVSRDGGTLKEFRATCPLGKQMVARACSRAIANNARRFLEAVLDDLPYPPRSIQVDGGGEFRAGFEDACEALNLPLAVLPPKCPRINGVVERASDRSGTEFRSLHQGEMTVRDVAPALAEYQRFHNHIRPHYALDLMTPMEYLRQQRTAEHEKSHMW